MKPTKRTRAVKKPRKRTTKRAVRGMEIGTTETPLAKLLKLKYLINDAYNHRQENDGETKSDKTWVMEEISNLRDGGWLSATKMKVANEMWNKYDG
mgnify:CR=1 FL=1